MKRRAYLLMKQWCDALLSHTIRTDSPYTDGALICPACHVLHGRVADLCLPLTLLWAEEDDRRYLEAADRLIDWSEYNLPNPDGLWRNDALNKWYGTSAFSAMSIGEALLHLGKRLPEQIRDKWTAIFVRMMDAVERLDEKKGFSPVSNYYCGFAASLALAWTLTGEERYLRKADYWAEAVCSRFDADGLLYGEGPAEAAEDGSHTVDMGYALEESLPLLLRYASLTGKRETFLRDRMRDHLAFLLPDGAMDNSFGTRHNKWTYWGSRTSDGLIEGLALVMDEPICADAAERVLGIYERCTHNGLLAMPMAHEVGEPTCLHHAFPHAKALALFICCAPDGLQPSRTLLACEEKYGVRPYQNGRLLLVSHGEFRATFSASAATYLPEFTANYGGSMNLLYHDRYGILCAATSAEYRPTEPLNQQLLRHTDSYPCMTAQFVVDGVQACRDKRVSLSADGTTVTAQAEKWQARYAFEGARLTITLDCEDGEYHLPIVCSKERSASLLEGGTCLHIDGGPTICSDVPMSVDTQRRIFHPVGGLLYLPIILKVRGCVTVTID